MSENILTDYQSFRARIKSKPFSISLENLEYGSSSIFEEAEIDFGGLSDSEKLACFLYSYYLKDMCVFKKHIMRYFNWSSYKVRKLVKEINSNKCNYYIEYVPTRDEDTGLLSGKGYLLNLI